MGELGGFLRVERVNGPKRPVAERVRDFEEYQETLPVDELKEQGARCMECGVPFCHSGCPLGNLIPDWNDLVYRDRWKDAIERAPRHQQLPGVHRPHLPGAVRGGVRARHRRRRRHDQADRGVDHRPRLRGGLGQAAAAGAAERPQRSAVIGSGPAGLAAAAELNQFGPPRDGVRAQRPHRRPAALRHPGLQAREDRRAAPRGHPRGRGHRVPDRRRGGQRHRRATSCASSSTRS